MPDAVTEAAAAPSVIRRRLPATVIALGFTSLFNDIGSEMIFPLLPLFLTGSLAAPPQFLGLVEGAAEALSSLLKLLSGKWTDRLHLRKPIVMTGYAIASVVRPVMAVVLAPWQVLAVRLTDRFGKGIRSSPRDALIAQSAVPGEVGRAFGFHQAMDHAGAVAGPLIASVMLANGLRLRTVFAWAALPGALALISLTLTKEKRRADRVAAKEVPSQSEPLPGRLRSYLLILLVFSLGNSSDAFLLVRAHQLGVATAIVPLLWSLFHVSKLVWAYAGGALSDRIGRPALLVTGWVIFALVYLGFGRASTAWQVWALFLIYGIYHGLTEPVEKAMVKDLSAQSFQGKAFGYYHFVVGGASLPAGLLTGWLWSHFGPSFALETGAALSLTASLGLWLWTRTGRNSAQTFTG